MLKENKVWLGYSANKTFTFQMADDYELSGKGAYQDEETGKKYCKVPAITWYTNLDIDKRHENLTLYKKYSPDEYPKYDNYDAIEVSKVSDIPCDYDGLMGVPITFMDKYNPDQFEILGKSDDFARSITIKNKIKNNPGRFYVSGKRIYDRIIIKLLLIS